MYNLHASGQWRSRISSQIRRGPLARPVEDFQVALIASEIALLLPGVSRLHGLMRLGTFGLSFVMIAYAYLYGSSGAKKEHPSIKPAYLVIMVLTLSIFHPTTNNWASGIGETMLNLAILAPLFWIPQLDPDLDTLRAVMYIIFCRSAFSACLGILQTYFPGRFAPPLASALAGQSQDYINSFTILTNSGARVFRPMGLSDFPGGAGGDGQVTILVGMALLLCTKKWWLRFGIAGAMVLGLGAVFLSQVRSILVMLLVGSAGFIGLLILRNFLVAGSRSWWGHRITRTKVASLIGVFVLVGTLGLGLSLSLSRQSVTDRMLGMFDSNSHTTYQENRGHFLQTTLDKYLPQYPLGAGLGRWGMMNQYLANNGNPDSPPIWAEIQWTGWLLDGGVPMWIGYGSAVLFALFAAFRIAISGDLSELAIYAAVAFATDLGGLAMTFDCPYFAGTSGIDFWFLNALVFAVWARRRIEARAAAKVASMEFSQVQAPPSHMVAL